MLSRTLQFYKTNSQQLTEQYNSVSFETVHKDCLDYLPNKGELILDVGAGSGRDALWLARQGYRVKAIEPVAEFFEQFKLNYQNNKIEWIEDSLPELIKLKGDYSQVSLILLSAVWMHLTTEERAKSLHTFSQLNQENGLLVISLRHGKSPDERVMYPVSIEEIESLAKKHHYHVKAIKQSDDQLSRSDVFWETIVLEKGFDRVPEKVLEKAS